MTKRTYRNWKGDTVQAPLDLETTLATTPCGDVVLSTNELGTVFQVRYCLQVEKEYSHYKASLAFANCISHKLNCQGLGPNE